MASIYLLLYLFGSLISDQKVMLDRGANNNDYINLNIEMNFHKDFI